MFGYDDEDNIGRDVEEEERKRVVINNAARRTTMIQSMTGLLCAVLFPHQSQVEVGPAAI